MRYYDFDDDDYDDYDDYEPSYGDCEPSPVMGFCMVVILVLIIFGVLYSIHKGSKLNDIYDVPNNEVKEVVK